MPRPVPNKYAEFGIVVLALFAWFLVQYILIRPPGLQGFADIVRTNLIAALFYGLVIYGMFYACCRKRRRPDLFFNISLVVACIGIVLWCVTRMWLQQNISPVGYVSIAHLPLTMSSAALLGLITDPLLLLPVFALYYRQNARRA